MLVLTAAQSSATKPLPQPDPGPPARVPPPEAGQAPPAPPLQRGHRCGWPQLPKLPCPKIPWPPKCPRPPHGAGKLHFETARGAIEVDANASPVRKLQTAGAVIAARVQDTAGQIARDLRALADGRGA